MIERNHVLLLALAALLLSGCLFSSPKSDLKDKISSSEKISFADFKEGAGREKFTSMQKEPESVDDYISGPELPPLVGEGSVPRSEADISYEVLEPGSATQEQIIEIIQSDESADEIISADSVAGSGSAGEEADGYGGSETPQENGSGGGEGESAPEALDAEQRASNIAVILPSVEDYYLDENPEIPPAGEAENSPQATSQEPEADEAFAANLEKIGQLLSDESAFDADESGKIAIAEKDASAEAIVGQPQGEVIPVAYFPVEETPRQNPEEMYETFSTGCEGVHSVDDAFFSEPNRVNIYAYYPEENGTILFGLLVDPKSETPLQPSERPFDNPQMNVYSDAKTISGIFESENPVSALVQTNKDGLIYLEGVDIPTSIKLMVAEQALKINGEGFGLVEESDCTKIREEWLRLRGEREKLGCGEIQKKLDALKNRRQNLESSLAEAQKKADAADKEVQRWKGHLKKFLKDSGLENADVSLDPPADADSKSYANFNRHGIQIWMGGNAGAERVISHFDKWKKEIDDYRKEIEKAQRAKDSAQSVLDGIKSDLDATSSEIISLETALADCLKKRAELEAQMQNLESLYRNCLEKLKAQDVLSKKTRVTASDDSWLQLDNIHTGEKISHFPELDKEIEGLEKEVGESDPECDEVKALQAAAKEALEKAKAKREEAVAKYREAYALYADGSLSESEIALDEANAIYAEARSLADEAKSKTDDAIRAKINCKMNLQGKIYGKEAEEKEWGEWIKVVRERNKTTGEPFKMDEDDAKVRLYIELSELTGKAREENGCDCPFQLLNAARLAAGDVYTKAIKDIGIGVMKAPIDALTPEGLMGKAAQKIASWTLGYLGADSFGEFLKDAIIDELVGAILPETDVPIIDQPVSGATSSAVSGSVDDWLAGSGVQIWAIEPEQESFQSMFCGAYECKNLKMVVIYNPNTRHMLTLIKGDCCPGVLMVSTVFNEEGVSIDSTAKYFP